MEEVARVISENCYRSTDRWKQMNELRYSMDENEAMKALIRPLKDEIKNKQLWSISLFIGRTGE
jgi:hypothetical protein